MWTSYENEILKYQCGFRPRKNTTDQLSVMGQSIEKHYEYNIVPHMLFLDFKEALDTRTEKK